MSVLRLTNHLSYGDYGRGQSQLMGEMIMIDRERTAELKACNGIIEF